MATTEDLTNLSPEQIEEILSWFLDSTRQRQYIGARYLPILGRKGEDTIEWDNGAPYEQLTIVMHNNDTYTSRCYVPTGAEITDTKYWARTATFNAQVEQYRQEAMHAVEVAEDAMEIVGSYSAITNAEIDTIMESEHLDETSSKYLDETGLAHFWSNVQNHIESSKFIVASDYRDEYADDDELFDSCLAIAAAGNCSLYVDIALTFKRTHSINMADSSSYPAQIMFNRNVEQQVDTSVCFELYTNPMTTYHSIRISGMNVRSKTNHANTLFYLHGATTVYIDYFDAKEFSKAFHLRNTRSGEWTEINHFENGHTSDCVYTFYLDRADGADESFHGNTFDCYIELPKNIDNAALYVGNGATLYNANIKLTTWSKCDSDTLSKIVETHGRIYGCNFELYNENIGLERVTTQFGGRGSYGCIYVARDATRNKVTGFAKVNGKPDYLPIFYEDGNTAWHVYLTFGIKQTGTLNEIYLDNDNLYGGKAITVGTTGQLQVKNGWDENGNDIYVPIMKNGTLINEHAYIYLSIGRWGGYDHKTMRIAQGLGSPYNHFKVYASYQNQEKVIEGTYSITDSGVFTLNSVTDNIEMILVAECVSM